MLAIAFTLAAATGGLVRWQATGLNRASIPWGTLAVNVIAAFVAGALANASSTMALIAVTAFLGSTSTFSTVAGELADRRDQPRVAAIYAALTIIGGIGAAWFGLSL